MIVKATFFNEPAKMPIDKFGTHMLSKYQNSSKNQNTPTYFCQSLSSIYSKCVLYVRGIIEKGNKNIYTLENHTETYICPISGKIESFEISPKETSIVLNHETPVTSDKLIGANVEKGVMFKFLKNSTSTKYLYVQIILRTPLN